MPSTQQSASLKDDQQFDASLDWVKDDFESPASDTRKFITIEDDAPAIGTPVRTPSAKEETRRSRRHVEPTVIRIRSRSVSSRSSSPELKEAGMSNEAKCLYEGPQKCLCCIDWVDKTPEEIAKAELTEDPHGGFAVLIRKRSGHGGESAFLLHSVVIQSPLIKTVLQKTLHGYPGVSALVEHLSFDAPFDPLFHRWDALVKAGKDDNSTETREHIKVLHDILEPEFEQPFQTLKECRMHGVITFKSLWVIFKPGELIYSTIDGQECVSRLRETTYQSSWGKAFFELACEAVDWDGSHFGLTTDYIPIYDFKGTCHATSLAAMPLELHPDRLSIKERLTARGRKFEMLRGYHFKAYDGPLIEGVVDGGQDGYQQQIQQTMQLTDGDERIIIDADAFGRFMHQPATPLVPLDQDPSEQFHSPRHPQPYDDPDYPVFHGGPPPPPLPHGRRNKGPHQSTRNRKSRPRIVDNSFGGPIMRKAERQGAIDPLTEEQMLLCVPFVRGFLLKKKAWFKFSVDGVHDISWDEAAFTSLVLPAEEKDLLLAFSEGQVNSKTNFDDFISGKGRGIVMLLSGPPGVGKTLTAESVAETMRVPLYTMSAGELGTDSFRIEGVLCDVLEKCAKWKAILLLDEADIFLEKRSLNDLQRNALVSVFLRLLEYYQGIMFLTTNRVEAFDPAFESRIDVAVNYPPLTAASRRQIWCNFIMRLRADERDFSEEELDRLAEKELNGRQIKSVVKTAQIVAVKKREALGVGHIRAIFRLRERSGF